MRPRRRQLLCAGLAVGVLAAAAVLLRPLLPAARLLGEFADPRDPLTEGVVEEPFSSGEGTVRGTLFRPVAGDAPFPGFVVCHGAAKDGYRDERLVRFARALARRGAVALAPDLEELRRFHVTASTVDQIVAAHHALVARRDLLSGGRASLVGISFAGTLCLLAAARPEVRDEVPAVFSFGGYADLEGLVRHWLTAAPEAAGGEYPVESYGKVIVVLQCLDPLVEEPERGPLREALENFLREKKRPPRPDGLGETARELWTAATTVGPAPVPLVERIVVALRPGLGPIEPIGRLGGIRAAPFLLHAAGDRLIPPSESARLAAALGGRTRTLVTSLFDHVTVRGEGSAWGERWRLVRFTAAFLGAAGL